MRRCLAVAAVVIPVLFAATRILSGAEQRFPYEGTIINENVEVRCGPGTEFYTTGTVRKMQQVTVHRHDHGGWYMISPPPGSFSWIEAALVKRSGDQGTVNIDLQSTPTGRAIVYIGSDTSDAHSYYGRELSHGDTVRILGEKLLSTPRGETLMLKIAPPRQEYRWVKGENVVPVSPERQKQLAEDPYQIPPQHRQRLASLNLEPLQGIPEVPTSKTETTLSPPELGGPTLAVTPQSTSGPASSQDDRERLKQIDEKYASMVSSDPAHWDLASIEREYRDLEKGSTAAIASMIPARLAAIAKRRQIADHYRRFVQLSHETSQRDAELAAQQAGYQMAMPLPERYAETSGPSLQPLPETAPQFAALPTDRQSSGIASSPVAPRLNGAGIIRPLQALPGQPAFGLFAPDGRMLALLEFVPGVEFHSWIGQEAGLIGQRSFNPRTGTDFIRVQRIVPVQLSR